MRVGGAEALVRWQHPREGLLPPAEFIPLAEHTGLIKPLGLWAIHAAMLQCRAWHAAAWPSTSRSTSRPRASRTGTRGGDPRGYCRDSDAASQWLTLEVTERAVMTNPARAKAILDATARDRGAHLDRRLRHRLLVARLPEGVAGRRGQGGPVVRQGHDGRTSATPASSAR